MPNYYALKYNSMYCSQINHGMQKIFQYPGLNPPNKIKVDSLTTTMLLLVVGHTSFWIYLINEVHLL
jgi:hypothetical protein